MRALLYIIYFTCVVQTFGFAQDLIINNTLQQNGIVQDLTAKEVLVLQSDSTLAKSNFESLGFSNIELEVSHFSDLLIFNSGLSIKVPGISRYNYSAQDLLDAGRTVSELVSQGGYTYHELYGLKYQDGYIGWLFPIGNKTRGLVYFQQQINEEIWGCLELEITGAFNSGISQGPTNTTSIVNQCGSSGNAASEADLFVSDNYDDWHLPSSSALQQLFNNAITTENPTGLPLGVYWSSTGIPNKSDAKAFDFGNGSLIDESRDEKYFVLPVRLFLE